MSFVQIDGLSIAVRTEEIISVEVTGEEAPPTGLGAWSPNGA